MAYKACVEDGCYYGYDLTGLLIIIIKLGTHIDFNYDTEHFIFNYSDSYLITLKNFTIYGGIFYLSLTENLAC